MAAVGHGSLRGGALKAGSQVHQRTPNGTPIHKYGVHEVIQEREDFWSKQWNRDRHLLDQVQQALRRMHAQLDQRTSEVPALRWDSAGQAFNRTPLGKAHGMDDIDARLLRHASPESQQSLCHTQTRMQHGILPQ